jgi:NADH:ubiquinone oxidoreductase subunit 4 (subunit M)
MVIIQLIICTVLLTILLLVNIPKQNKSLIKAIALNSSGFVLILTCLFLFTFNCNFNNFQNNSCIFSGCLDSLNFYILLGLDGISLFFFILSSFLIFLCLLFIWPEKNCKTYSITLLLTQALPVLNCGFNYFAARQDFYYSYRFGFYIDISLSLEVQDVKFLMFIVSSFLLLICLLGVWAPQIYKKHLFSLLGVEGSLYFTYKVNEFEDHVSLHCLFEMLGLDIYIPMWNIGLGFAFFLFILAYVFRQELK